MSLWQLPLRSAPPEPLCAPSTSYTSYSSVSHSVRSKSRRNGSCSRRGRALQHIRCQASQAVHSYHNAYKLLHQPKGASGMSPEPPEPEPPELEVPEPSSELGTLQRPQVSRAPQLTTSQLQHEPQHQQLMPPPGHPQPTQPVATVRPSEALTRPGAAGPAASLAHSGQLPPTVDLISPDFKPQEMSSLFSFGDAADPTGDDEDGHVGFDSRRPAQWPYRPHSVSLADWKPPRTSREHQTALLHAITTCPTYMRLHQLVTDHAADFNTYHSCAALNRMIHLHGKGLGPRESRLFKEGCSTLQAVFRRQVPELQSRSIVVVAYGLARLELPDRELLAGLLAASEPQLHQLQPQGLASLLWAFARQGYQPPARWMDAWLTVCGSKLKSFDPANLATTMWALSKLHFKVAPPRQAELLQQIQAQMDKFSGRGLSNVVYSLALAHQHPGPELIAAVQARAVELGPNAFTPQGMTQLCWGLAKLGAAPTPALLQLLRAHVVPRLRLPRGRTKQSSGADPAQRQAAAAPDGRVRSPYTGIDLSTLMYTLAVWGTRPSPRLGRRLLACLQPLLPTLEPNQLCNCVWACARLHMFPNASWIRVFIDESFRRLPNFGPADLAQSLWALARLQTRPPPGWMSSAVLRLQQCALLFGPVEVASTLWALAKLGVREERLPAEVMALLFSATDRRLSSFKPQELTAIIWALAVMRRRPDKEWTAEFLKVSYHKLGSMSGWCLATLSWSLAELALVPPPAWIYSYVNAARALLEATPLPQRALQPAAAGAEAAPRPAGGVGAAAPASQGAAGMAALDLAQIILALRRLNSGRGGGAASGGAGPGLAKVEEFLEEAERRLTQMEAADSAYTRQQIGLFMGLTKFRSVSGAAEEAKVATLAVVAKAKAGGSGSGAKGSAKRKESKAQSARVMRRKEYWQTKLQLAGEEVLAAAAVQAATPTRATKTRGSKTRANGAVRAPRPSQKEGRGHVGAAVNGGNGGGARVTMAELSVKLSAPSGSASASFGAGPHSNADAVGAPAGAGAAAGNGNGNDAAVAAAAASSNGSGRAAGSVAAEGNMASEQQRLAVV